MNLCLRVQYLLKTCHSLSKKEKTFSNQVDFYVCRVTCLQGVRFENGCIEVVHLWFLFDWFIGNITVVSFRVHSASTLGIWISNRAKLYGHVGAQWIFLSPCYCLHTQLPLLNFTFEFILLKNSYAWCQGAYWFRFHPSKAWSSFILLPAYWMKRKTNLGVAVWIPHWITCIVVY